MLKQTLHDMPRLKLAAGGISLILAAILFIPNGRTNDANAEVIINPSRPIYDLTRHDLYLEEFDIIQPHKETLTLKSGDSLGPLLQNTGFEPQDAYTITNAFAEIYDPRKLRVGQKFDVYYSNNEFSHLTYKPNLDRTIFLSRNADGTFKSRDVAAEFQMETVRVKSEIQNSLYLDANSFGAPDKVIQQFANIYEYSVDFQRDIQPGDAFEMMFEVARDKHGNIIKAGDLLYTSFSPRSKTLEYYLYEDANGQENFYDAEGKTAKRKLRATPINGARLSSSYGKRRHPILGYRKMHAGVDFAAPTGTPIMAAGSGTVDYVGRNGGYGKYIRLKHSDGYKTAYAHMSRYASGMRKGVRVRQDQVIGYVGTTGRSTGPHLHYEVHLNGKKINPRRLSQLSGKPINKADMPAFQKRRAELDAIRGEITAMERKAPEPELSVELID